MLWTVDLIDDSNRSGAMEFVISSAANPDSFFPVDVSFSAQHTLADVKVVTVCAAAPLELLLGSLIVPAQLQHFAPQED